MQIQSDPRPVRGPVRRGERALAPDLARGFMLLFIALANSAVAAFGTQPGVEQRPEGLERGFNLFVATLVDSRAFPVFAIMFGYGLVQLARRQQAAGAAPAGVRSVLLRRNAWLVAFGVAHGVLLNFGDFLGAYGLVGIVATLVLLPRGDRVHRIVLWIWGCSALSSVVTAVLLVLDAVRTPSGTAGVPTTQRESLVADDYFSATLARITEWPGHTSTVLGFITVVWLGIWAARRRLLEDPASHRVLLRGTAAVGLGGAVAGGLPLGLISSGLWHTSASTAELAAVLHATSGLLAGPGYVALFGLLTLVVPRRSLAAVAALGQRSLSGYLFQSIAWLVLLSPYALALGEIGSTALTTASIAVLVWSATVLGAWYLDRRSARGPAEDALRRLTYRL
ncbi:DUF418 domain-containing protein [Saccharopolyspora sp. K220]|uniref:DUF418 domain-containing protein n=1 Tax=Saccharopolyspora soli TaxID=2926618 RepID=UPI001F563050|nr:DUF418 domain-containing protein [Saccharopolyspora soli]MCI2423352.1 DUF418 domain-containing protein [Saccharopolyspora soli]